MSFTPVKICDTAATFIFNRNGDILFGLRLTGEGVAEADQEEYEITGGKIDDTDADDEAAAKREAYEETLIEGIQDFTFLTKTNRYVNNIYFTISYYMGRCDRDGTPIAAVEPTKSGGWKWYSLDNLPEKLFSDLPSVVLEFYNELQEYGEQTCRLFGTLSVGSSDTTGS